MTDKMNINADSLRALAKLFTGDPMDKIDPDRHFPNADIIEPWSTSGQVDQYLSTYNDIKTFRDDYKAALVDYHDAAKAVLDEVQLTSKGITKMADRVTAAEGKNVGDIAKVFEGY